MCKRVTTMTYPTKATLQAIPSETSCSTKSNVLKGSQTWVDGDSYVGAWSAGLRSGWGATYWNNGNMHEGNNAADGGVMHGQALHFKWGDGAAFRSESDSLSSVTTGRALRVQPELSFESSFVTCGLIL